VIDRLKGRERFDLVFKNMQRHVRVKICGVTNRADAEAAIDLGADALGFNAWPGSKRFIDLRDAAEWISALPPFVTKVAVTVNPTFDEALEMLALPFIDALQLHGHENEAFCARLAEAAQNGESSPISLPSRFAGVRQFFKALAVRDAASLENAARFHTPHILLDAFSPTEFGGTGKKIDLDLAAQFIAAHPQLHVILSGGLTPENVAEAIRRAQPRAVDVASGVEKIGDPRSKDARKMRDFIRAVRALDDAI